MLLSVFACALQQHCNGVCVHEGTVGNWQKPSRQWGVRLAALLVISTGSRFFIPDRNILASLRSATSVGVILTIHQFVGRYFSYIEQCKDPKACTIVLRGAGKDFLMEMERNLQDAMNVARNVMVDARLAPGGGATEMAVAWVRIICKKHILTATVSNDIIFLVQHFSFKYEL